MSANACRSMTGFGREEVEGAGVCLELELRSVNSRYLDISFRLPRNYQRFEPLLRQIISQELERGRVELTINRTVIASDYSVRFDQKLADEYMRLGQEFFEKKKLWSKEVERDFALQVCSRKEVLERDEDTIHESEEQELLRTALLSCLERLVKMRIVEGKALSADIQSRFERIAQCSKDIRKKIGEKEQDTQARLREKMEKILSEQSLDEQRLALEVAILIDKSDISEELTRIESHLSQVETILKTYPHGRKVEFLLQELGREFNTIASKAQDASISQQVIEVKAEIEKIKEQIQNVE